MKKNTETKLLKDKNYAPENLGNVCILGLGKTGLLCADYFLYLLKSRVDSVHVYAGPKTKESMQAADKLLKKGATVSFDDETIERHHDLCIASPGIPKVSELFCSACDSCDEVISEIEFAWRESSKNIKWIAVTGTNGKTTTTSLIYYILKNANRRVQCVGNIGNVALDAVWQDTKKSPYNVSDYYVAELSSYQLALTDKFSPYVAILLNITPDHINWHGSFDEYFKAKKRIFNNAKIGIINTQDFYASKMSDEVSPELETIIKPYFDKDIVFGQKNGEKIEIIKKDKLLLKGNHNIINSTIAVDTCLALGISPRQIASSLSTFKPLEHRLEPCGIIAGVRIINDSKATNVDSVLVAMDAFDKGKAVFLMGGRDKNTDLKELVKKANKRLKGVVCYGEASDRLYSEFKKYASTDADKLLNKSKKDLIVKRADNMRRAFYSALDEVYPGDYIVLSPACSSFDEFPNFEVRGQKFKELVASFK